MGICGTCKVMKLSGEVEMEHNGGITDDDVEEGYILACCSVPKGDVRIEY
jgi:ferredoxin